MGEPVLFIPGLMCDVRLFLPQLVHLGATHSVQVALPTQGDTVERISEAILATAPPQFAMVGHGFGGEVALDILRRDMRRVTRLVLISTDALGETPQVAAAREARIVAARSGRIRQAIAEEYPEAIFADTPWRAEIRALIDDMAMSLGEGVFQRQSRASQRRPDQQKTLRRAMLPALILAGEQDTLVPLRRQDFAAKLMPYGTISVLENAGHMPTLEQPEAVTAALQAFLNGPLMLR
jgi:pimeloyl-ACP methyl ester carboxylesterase